MAFKQLTDKNTRLNRGEKNCELLHYLARNIITVPTYFEDVVTHFSEVLPKIVSFAVSVDAAPNSEYHKRNTVMLGKIVQLRNDLKW